MIIIYIFFSIVVLIVFVIYELTHLIDGVRKGLVKNVPRILLGGFFTGCVGAAILVGVFYRYYRFFLSDVSGWGAGTGGAPGLIALGVSLTKAGMGISGFFLGFLLGAGYLRRKFKRK